MAFEDMPRPGFSSALCYRDPKAAFAWLEKAFGFEPLFAISDSEGNVLHSEMTFGGGIIMVGSEWSAMHKSPASLEGLNMQTVHVHLEEDIDAHCARARAAGAVIGQEPENQFYGDRTYRAVDPEGHIWTFGQTVEALSQAQWDKAGGVVTTLRPAT